jgi:hypothetical protein
LANLDSALVEQNLRQSGQLEGFLGKVVTGWIRPNLASKKTR